MLCRRVPPTAAEAEAERPRALQDEFHLYRRQQKHKNQDPQRVLVRLKMEHTGFTTLNNQIFGFQFVEQVVRF